MKAWHEGAEYSEAAPRHSVLHTRPAGDAARAAAPSGRDGATVI